MFRYLSVLFVFLSQAAQAIVNIESERLDNPNLGLNGSVAFTLDGKTGSSEKVEFGTELKLIKSASADETIFILEKDYAEVNDQKNTDNSFVHLRYLTKDTPNWGHEVFVQAENDDFRALKSRYLVGLGMRYTLTPVNELSANVLGFGFYYEDEAYADEGTNNDEKNIRGNFYWTYKHKISDFAALRSTFYFQPKVNDFSDEKGLWVFSVSSSITEKLLLKISVDVVHDTKTPESVVATETSYETEIVYVF